MVTSLLISENCFIVFRLLESHWKQEELTFLREQFWKVYVHILDIFTSKETGVQEKKCLWSPP